MGGRGKLGRHQDAGGVEGLVSLAREPRLGAGVLAGVGVGEAEKPLDALFNRPLEDLGGVLGAGARLAGRVAVGWPAAAARRGLFAGARGRARVRRRFDAAGSRLGSKGMQAQGGVFALLTRRSGHVWSARAHSFGDGFPQHGGRNLLCSRRSRRKKGTRWRQAQHSVAVRT